MECPTGLFVGRGGAPLGGSLNKLCIKPCRIQQVCLVGAVPHLGGSLCFVFSCPDWKRKKAMQYLRVFEKGPGGIVKDVEREPWNNNL